VVAIGPPRLATAAYHGGMLPFTLSAASNCQTNSAGAVIAGTIFVLAPIAGLIVFAILNAGARRRLAVAHAELEFLRPENARLQHWLNNLAGAPVVAHDAGAYPTETPIPPEWYTDPSGRHEYRLWDGASWTEDVSDHGVASKDALD